MNKFIWITVLLPLSTGVTEAMLPYFSEKYGIPQSLYTIGRQAKRPSKNQDRKSPTLSELKRGDHIHGTAQNLTTSQ